VKHLQADGGEHAAAVANLDSAAARADARAGRAVARDEAFLEVLRMQRAEEEKRVD
jgi:hypothetical protein